MITLAKWSDFNNFSVLHLAIDCGKGSSKRGQFTLDLFIWDLYSVYTCFLCLLAASCIFSPDDGLLFAAFVFLQSCLR